MTNRKDKEEYEAWRRRYDGQSEPPLEDDRYNYTGSPNPKRFYRSRTDSVIAGVCGGLAERFGWEPTLLRVLAAIGLISPISGLVFVGYLVMWMVTPKTPRQTRTLTPEEDTFWRSVSDKPSVTFSNLRYKFMDLEDRLQAMERSVTSDEWRLRKQFKDLERG